MSDSRSANSCSSSVVEGMKDELTCGICLQLLLKPKTLPCLHTYCEECLLGHIRAKTEANEPAHCPLNCTANSHLTEEIVKETKVNFNYVSMIEKLQNPDWQTNETHSCSECDESVVDDSEAVGYCRDCKKYLCTFCVRSHKRKRGLSNHQINPLKESSPLTTEKYCTEHCKEKLCMYCATHDSLICTVCAVLKHRDCSVNYVDSKTVESELQTIPKQVSTLKVLYEKLDKEMCELNEEKKEVQDTYGRIQQSIEKRSSDLNAELNEWYKHTMKHHSQRYRDKETGRNDVSLVISQFEKIFSSSDRTIDSLYEKTQLTKKAKYLQEEELATDDLPGSAHGSTMVEFLETESIGTLIHKNIKEMDLKVISPEVPTQGEMIQVQVITGDRKIGGASVTARVNDDKDIVTVVRNDDGNCIVKWTPQSHLDQQLEVELGEHKVKKTSTVQIKRQYTPLTPLPSEMMLDSPPLGVCFVSDDTIAVTSNGKKIQLVNVNNGSMTKDEEIDGNFVRPYFMAVDKAGDHLWVTDREAHNIKRLSLRDHQVNISYGSRGLGYNQLSHPRGIAVSSDDQYVYVSDMKNNRIVVLKLNNDGSLSEKSTIGQNMLNQPAGIAFNRRDELVVCDDRNCRLALFTADGRHIKNLGCGRNGLGLMCSPIGIAIDTYGRYIVGEFGSHCVTALSTEGDVLSCTRSAGGIVKEFTYPRGVAVDHKGYIYVADHGNKRLVRM